MPEIAPKKTKAIVNILFSLFLLSASIAVLVTLVLGWFAVSKKTALYGINLTVTQDNVEVHMLINGQETRKLENVSPGNRFMFEISATNIQSDAAVLNFYFSGFTEPKEKYSAALDKIIPFNLCDVFMIEPLTPQGTPLYDAYYFRDAINLETGRVAIGPADIPLAVGATFTAKFYLIFAGSHYYMDGGTLTSGDINIFQGETLAIRNIIIDLE